MDWGYTGSRTKRMQIIDRMMIIKIGHLGIAEKKYNRRGYGPWPFPALLFYKKAYPVYGSPRPATGWPMPYKGSP